MTDASPFLEPQPDLPEGWSARVPEDADVAALVALRGADRAPYTGEGGVDGESVRSEVVGTASWTRRQLVVSRGDDLRGWLSVQDRAAGRTTVSLWLERDDEADQVSAALYAWADDQGRAVARLRRLDSTRMDASPFADDVVQRGWLQAAGYVRRRTWLHMARPVDPTEVLPPPREGVTIRPVGTHENGVAVAKDLQVVHQMLEESFEDHFNSYRESFPEFVQRLREDPGHRWDHWWLAFVSTEDGAEVPAGAIVCSVVGADATGAEGTYVDYIGVNRDARGRGVAKGLLYTVLADAAERGRNRVGLEVDADSPTRADEIYVSMGWSTDYVTESWFRDVVPDRWPVA
jgi:GNAT superfamily N-acetyltransferase